MLFSSPLFYHNGYPSRAHSAHSCLWSVKLPIPCELKVDIRLSYDAAFVVFAAVIVLALCAHVTNTTVTLFQAYFVFAALGIATSLLAFLSLPVMYVSVFPSPMSNYLNIRTFRLIVDNIRKGAVTSMIVVEISWLGERHRLIHKLGADKFLRGLLWVLFLSTAATASQAATFTFGNSCLSPNGKGFQVVLTKEI